MKRKLIYLLLICAIPVIGNTQKNLHLELIKKEPVVNTKKRSSNRKLLPKRNYNDSIVAWTTPYLHPKKGVADSMFIIFPDGKQIEVEPIPGILISDKARLIVKYGQKGLRPKTKAHSLIFYDFDGNVIKRYDNKHKHLYDVTISENGFFVCRSRLLNDIDDSIYLFLYDSQGNELNRINTRNERTDRITISRDGDYIGYCYTNGYIPVEHKVYNIKILNKQLETIFSVKDIGYIYKFTFLNNNEFLVITGDDYTSAIDLNNEKLLWVNDKSYVTGEFPIVLFPQNKVMALLTNRTTEWEVFLLDTQTGNEIFSHTLPNEEAKVDQSLFLIENNQLKIIGHNNTYFFQLKQ